MHVKMKILKFGDDSHKKFPFEYDFLFFILYTLLICIIITNYKLYFINGKKLICVSINYLCEKILIIIIYFINNFTTLLISKRFYT